MTNAKTAIAFLNVVLILIRLRDDQREEDLWTAPDASLPIPMIATRKLSGRTATLPVGWMAFANKGDWNDRAF